MPSSMILSQATKNGKAGMSFTINSGPSIEGPLRGLLSNPVVALLCSISSNEKTVKRACRLR